MTKSQTEGRRTKKTKVDESLSFLIEDALERSEVVLAAESIVEKLQGIAEDLATIEAKDIMPMFDSLTNAFGPQVAQKFNTVATEQVRQLVAALQAAKGALDQEILRLKQGVEGGSVSDMSMDAGTTEMTPPEGPPAGGPSEPPMGGDAGLSEVPPDMAGNAEDDMAGGGIPGTTGPAVGRPRKESAKPKGKPLSERKIKEDAQPAPSHSHESSYFTSNLSNLSVFHGGAGRLAQGIANMIRTDELSLEQRKSLASVLSHLAAFASEPSHWAGVNPDSKLEMSLQSAGIWKVESPAVQRIVQQLKRLAHLLSLHHDRMLESNIRMLRTAADPDALVLKTFRTKLAEHRDSQMAAIRTARTFAIDVEDVVSVVREAAARRPFPNAESNKPNDKGAKRAPRREVDEEDATAQGTVQPAQLQQAEADQALGNDVPIFPVAQAGPVQAGVTPNPEGSEMAVGATNGQPANQSNSTVKPQTPGDMRANQQQQRVAQQQHDQTKQQVQQAIKTAKPQTQQGQQQPKRPQQPQQPQRAQQPQSQPKPAFKLPGQPMDKNNPAMRRRTVSA